MELTNDAKFMHCLPVRRNVVVSDVVIDSANSLVIEEATNRIVSAQTIFNKILKMSEIKVIKIGGKVIDDEAKLDQFLKDFAQIEEKKILVHGGGKIASDVAEKLGLKSKMINGRRITDSDMIDVVTMVYGGLVNKKIVAKLQALGCNAIGLSGADMNLIQSKKEIRNLSILVLWGISNR